MLISYHTWKDLRDCPKRFRQLHIYKMTPTVPQNEYFTLYGSLIQKFFENYCNIWGYKTPNIPPDVVPQWMRQLFDALMLTAEVNWSGPGASDGPDEIVAKASEDANKILAGQSLNYFLNTKSEIGVSIKLSSGHSMTGRMDFVHEDPGKSILLFDGKGTSKKGKNIDIDQLYWYALLYRFHYGKYPNELGFFYYKLNEFEPVMFNLDILNEFRARVSLMLKSLNENRSFEATPSAKACRYCPYLNSCPEGIAGKVSRARPSKAGITAEITEEGIATFGL